jgi:hypothetical protein
MKYTTEMLAEAARQSTTIAGVLRQLNIRVTGGAHSHIKRRLAESGIDTSHFTGKPDLRGRCSPRALTPDEILVIRPPHRRRPPGALLTRAMLAKGVALECAWCHVGPLWNGEVLVLHVDVINGDYHDCRLTNLRFLCPNCHSQTHTFAGRGKRPNERGLDRQQRDASGPPPPVTPMTVQQAARLLGCSRSHFYRLRRSLTGEPRKRDPGIAERGEARRLAVIACALDHPADGPRKIAARLNEQGLFEISHGTVSNVLRAAGLNTEEARRASPRTG